MTTLRSCLACVAVLCAAQASAQTVIDFGNTNGFIDVARSQVTGNTLLPGWEGQRAVVWIVDPQNNVSWYPLPAAYAPWGYGIAISTNARFVLAEIEQSFGEQYLLFGLSPTFPAEPAYESITVLPIDCAGGAFDVANDGTVVGSCNNRPFVIPPGGALQELPLPAGAFTGFAEKISADARTIVGGAGNCAYRWIDGVGSYVLGVSGCDSGAIAVSPNGQIAGGYGTSPAGQFYSPFFSRPQGTAFPDIAPAGLLQGTLTAITNDGLYVGYGSGSVGVQAFRGHVNGGTVKTFSVWLQDQGITPPSSPIQYVLGAHASALRYYFAASSVDGRYFLIVTPRSLNGEIDPDP